MQKLYNHLKPFRNAFACACVTSDNKKPVKCDLCTKESVQTYTLIVRPATESIHEDFMVLGKKLLHKDIR